MNTTGASAIQEDSWTDLLSPCWTTRCCHAQIRGCFHTTMHALEINGITCAIVLRTIGGPYTVLVAEQLAASEEQFDKGDAPWVMRFSKLYAELAGGRC